mgnify:CR=1 FL=1
MTRGSDFVIEFRGLSASVGVQVNRMRASSGADLSVSR